ncbi:hypothetical protein BURK1_02334 [Burkholderiales bacterium]|nr:hypothetical protein BURK1_02334 [Burkholderiales bacterium]
MNEATAGACPAPSGTTPVLGGGLPAAVGSTFANDTVRIAGIGQAPSATVVRPALAVLFRIAVGPEADRYVPRFLDFERSGRARPGWHWPAFLAPPVWAFYRKLWPEGIAFSLLPVAGAFAFAALGASLDGSDATWWAALAVSVWLFPAVLSTLAADALLWGRVRRDVASVESGARSASKAVEALSQRKPTSLAAAIAFGGGSIVVAATLLWPPIRAEYVAHAARDAVATALASLTVVQDAVESAWDRTGTFAHARNVALLVAQNDRRYVEDVAVSPSSGRVRVSLGPSVPGAAGKSILLAPAVDEDRQVRWMCVPVDIPTRYLPPACRR